MKLMSSKAVSEPFETESKPKEKEVIPKKRAIESPDLDKAGLTAEQRIAAETLYEYLQGNSGHELYLLEGYAGTGKTFTISLVIEMFLTSPKATNISITAPVNKAVKILRNAANYEDKRISYQTVHSLLGLKPKISPKGEMEFVKDFNIPATIDSLQVLILDEVSMLNDELFKMLDFYVTERGLKIIFIGDPAQIPPVNSKEHKGGGDAIPLILKQQEKHNIGVVRLTEIVRQKGTNPIIALATSVRNDLKRLQPIEGYTTLDASGNEGVITLNMSTQGTLMVQTLKGWFTSAYFEESFDFAKVIAWTNKTVDAFNNMIRKMRFGKAANKISVGEKLIADVPILDSEGGIPVILFTTNDEFTVIEYEVRQRTIKGRDRGVAHQISYYWAYVRSDDSDKEQHIRIIHEDSEEEFSEILKAMVELAQEKTKEGKGGAYWKDYYAMLENFAQVKYNYAITTHKAQGSTYKNVMVIESDIDANRNVVERNRIKYTAVTRPSSLLVLVN